MDKFEIQQLRDLPIEGVAERLGIEVRRHKALCPFHDDHHASLSFNVRTNSYRCFVCDAHGDTIDLVMGVGKKGFREACRWLDPSVILPTPSPRRGTPLNLGVGPCVDNCGGSTRRGLYERKTFDASKYERFFERPCLSEAARRFLYAERRLDERVVRWCRLTSWRDREGTEWLQIPYYDCNYHLTGIQNRNLTPGTQPRFRFPTGSQCGIYNLPVLNRLSQGDVLYITEGASDCWSMLSSGHKAIAIPSATLLSPRDKELLLSLSSSLSFRMSPDRDLPGERLFLNLQEILPNLQHLQLPQGCKDFSEYYVKLKTDESI